MKFKVFTDFKIFGVSGFSFWAIEPVRKDGNDRKLPIWLNTKLFCCSVFFETVGYVFSLKERLYIGFILLFGVFGVSGFSVESIYSTKCEARSRVNAVPFLKAEINVNRSILVGNIFWYFLIYKVIYITNESWKYLFFTYIQQEVQGLQPFAFPVVIVNDEHGKSRFKRKLSD